MYNHELNQVNEEQSKYIDFTDFNILVWAYSLANLSKSTNLTVFEMQRLTII